MDRPLTKFRSFEEAEAADKAYYQSLTVEQRLEIFFNLLAQHNDQPEPRLERVYRIVKLESR